MAVAKNNPFIPNQACCSKSDEMRTQHSEAGARKFKIIFWLILLLTGGTFLADVFVQQWKIIKLNKDAEASNSDAIYTLGQMYEQGWRVRKDETKAMQWYQRGAQASDKKCMFKLGLAYKKGRGVTRDYTKALEWFRKAAQAEHPDAMFNLGLMYHNGYGIEKDCEQAVNWYKKAASLGQKDAQKILNSLDQTW